MIKIFFILFCLLTCGCSKNFKNIGSKDVGDIIEETSDLFFPEVVGDIADDVIDFIDDRSILELIHSLENYLEHKHQENESERKKDS